MGIEERSIEAPLRFIPEGKKKKENDGDAPVHVSVHTLLRFLEGKKKECMNALNVCVCVGGGDLIFYFLSFFASSNIYASCKNAIDGPPPPLLITQP